MIWTASMLIIAVLLKPTLILPPTMTGVSKFPKATPPLEFEEWWGKCFSQEFCLNKKNLNLSWSVCEHCFHCSILQDSLKEIRRLVIVIYLPGCPWCPHIHMLRVGLTNVSPGAPLSVWSPLHVGVRERCWHPARSEAGIVAEGKQE